MGVVFAKPPQFGPIALFERHAMGCRDQKSRVVSTNQMQKRSPSSAVLAFVFLAGSAALADPAHANDLRHKTTIGISFLGVPLGDMTMHTRIEDDRYAMSGKFKTNGVVSVVAKTTARFGASGRIDGMQAVPDKHTLSYAQRKYKGSLDVAFQKGDVRDVRSKPAIKYKASEVALKDGDLRAVLDPVSALLFPVAAGDEADGRKICKRSVPVFDGKNRFTLEFEYKSKREASAEGFKGPVFTCSIRYTPVAGMRMTRKNVKFMRQNRDMEIDLARLGKSSVFGLYGFRVKTRRGMAKGTARRFLVR